MAGKSLINNKINKNLRDWLDNIISSRSSWEANNIHVDELPTLNKITRDSWIDTSFLVFNSLLTQIELPKAWLIFLHITLTDTKDKFLLDSLSLNWLKNNIHKLTPPSFNCTTLDYYENFYKNELIRCMADNSVLKLVNPTIRLGFFYRTYFDKLEKMHLREIYVFKAI